LYELLLREKICLLLTVVLHISTSFLVREPSFTTQGLLLAQTLGG